MIDRHLRQPAAAGRRLCVTCCHRLTDGFRELPRLYAECGAMLGGDAAAGMRQKVTGGSRPGLALNGSASEARTVIVAILSSWSALVAQERQVRAPQRKLVPLASFLVANSGWLTGHPAAGDVSAEVARAVAMARRAAYPDPVKRIDVGPCVMPGCDGQLSATVRPSRAGEGTRVRCGADPDHRWDGHEWTRLRRQMRQRGHQPEERWLAPADVARLWRTPTGTVYRLASEQSWRRITRAGRTYYAESDVHRCFSRRAVRASQEG